MPIQKTAVISADSGAEVSPYTYMATKIHETPVRKLALPNSQPRKKPCFAEPSSSDQASAAMQRMPIGQRLKGARDRGISAPANAARLRFMQLWLRVVKGRSALAR